MYFIYIHMCACARARGSMPTHQVTNICIACNASHVMAARAKNRNTRIHACVDTNSKRIQREPKGSAQSKSASRYSADIVRVWLSGYVMYGALICFSHHTRVLHSEAHG